MTIRMILVLSLFIASMAAAPAAEEGLAPIPLSLREAVAQAIERNLDLEVARLDPPQVEQTVTLAESVFDPRFGASAGYGERKSEPQNAFSPIAFDGWDIGAQWYNPISWGGYYSLDFEYAESAYTFLPLSSARFGLVPDDYQGALILSYNQPLLRNFGLSINRTAIEQATNNMRISEQQLVTGLLTTVNLVEQVYWDLAGALRQIEVSRSSLELAEDLLRQTRIKVDVGTVAPIEVTTAEAEVAARKQSVIYYENVARNLEDQLRRLLNVPADSADWARPIQPTDLLAWDRVQFDVAEMVQRAMENRPELKIAKTQMNSLELQERYDRNQRRPDLTAQFSYGLFGNNYKFDQQKETISGIEQYFCNNDPDNPFALCGTPFTFQEAVFLREDQSRSAVFEEIPSNRNNNWRVGLLFSIPIGNRAARAQHTRTKLAIEQQQLAIASLEEQIRVEVRTAIRNIASAAEQIAAARANVELQQKKVEAEQKRYENGLSIAFRVAQVQTDLADAQTTENLAVVAFNKNLSALGRATGLLLQARGISVEEAVAGQPVVR